MRHKLIDTEIAVSEARCSITPKRIDDVQVGATTLGVVLRASVMQHAEIAVDIERCVSSAPHFLVPAKFSHPAGSRPLSIFTVMIFGGPMRVR